jgi:long-chain acyl-CoA synthetase
MARAFDELVSVYLDACRQFEKRELFGTKLASGEWQWTTYGEFRSLVDRARSGLSAMGVGPGDRVAIVSRNRVEWAVVCYATYGLEAALVPMYEAQREEEIGFILADSGAKVVFASTPAIYEKVRRLQRSLPGLEHVIGIDRPVGDEPTYTELLGRGDAVAVAPRHPRPDAIAGLVYTSGTTGRPKGVLLSHRNIASNLNAIREAFPISPDERTLSFLPWAHAFGQTCELHYLLSSGASCALNRDVHELLVDLKDVAPTVLIAVPRVFNGLYEAVLERIGSQSTLVRKLFAEGIEARVLARKGEHVGAMKKVEALVDDKLFFSRIRNRLGGRLKFVISGSATLSPEVAEFIDAIGIPVYEGYGLSETSPVVSMNRPGHSKAGTVGMPIPGVRIEIDRSCTGDPVIGEILVYGPNVMVGYHNRPEETARAMTSDGGLRTGDLGFVDDEGYLHVVGRIKDQYKLDSGRYVMPGPIEERLSLSPFIANVMLYGADHPYNVAVVVPERQALRDWARSHDVDLAGAEGDVRTRELLRAQIQKQSQGLRPYEVPRRFVVAREDFDAANGLLTPTLKVKRQKVLELYGAELEALYVLPEEPPRVDSGATS